MQALQKVYLAALTAKTSIMTIQAIAKKRLATQNILAAQIS